MKEISFGFDRYLNQVVKSEHLYKRVVSKHRKRTWQCFHTETCSETWMALSVYSMRYPGQTTCCPTACHLSYLPRLLPASHLQRRSTASYECHGRASSSVTCNTTRSLMVGDYCIYAWRWCGQHIFCVWIFARKCMRLWKGLLA